MDVLVKLETENGQVRAAAVELPALSVTADTQEAAIAKLLPLITSHYKARVISLTFGVETEEAAAPAEPVERLTIPNSQLLEFAKKHRPPQAWYDEKQDVF